PGVVSVARASLSAHSAGLWASPLHCVDDRVHILISSSPRSSRRPLCSRVLLASSSRHYRRKELAAAPSLQPPPSSTPTAKQSAETPSSCSSTPIETSSPVARDRRGFSVMAAGMLRWNRRYGNHHHGELGAATNILECANFAQTQGKPRCISPCFKRFSFYHYIWSHVMCIRYSGVE
ncbi:hypothetical protein EJB05_43398, partial [Eragrostis curvula]